MNWNDIDLNGKTKGQIKTVCPNCRHRRTKPDKSLSVNIDLGVWNCHYCNWSGVRKEDVIEDVAPIVLDMAPEVEAYMVSRGISRATLAALKVSSDVLPFDGKKRRCVAFKYFLNEKHVNTKWRSALKDFRMDPSGTQCLYNGDVIRGAEWLVITEGEIDALSFHEAGIPFVASVPNGANKNFKYLEHYDLSKIKKFYIASDDDAKGNEFAEALKEELGDNCYRIKFKGYKDANELLVAEGKDALKRVFLEAEAMSDRLKMLSELNEDRYHPEKDYDFDATWTYVTKMGNEFPIAGKGDIITISGASKSMKTTMLATFVAGALARKKYLGMKIELDGPILWIDSEQAPKWFKRTCDLIYRTGGPNVLDEFYAYPLKKYATEERWRRTEALIEEIKPSLVIIDGMADYVIDFNDNKEAAILHDKVVAAQDQYNFTLANVLHLRTDGAKVNGAIGTLFEKKSSLVIVTTKKELDDGTQYFEASCKYSRGGDFPKFFYVVEPDFTLSPFDMRTHKEVKTMKKVENYIDI